MNASLVPTISTFARILGVLGLAWLLAGPAAAAEPARNPAFGVMIHYLPGRGEVRPWLKPEVEGLANALAEMRASYLIVTLGQNNGQYIAPNASMVALCPKAMVNEPRQDLPLELGRALAARGIGLMLYLPFRAPQADRYLMDCLGDVDEQSATSAGFIRNWSKVIGYWSAHYGPLLKGWWFDGVYNTSGMSGEDWRTLCAAANRGGRDRLLAFNSGEGLQRFQTRSAPCQNLAAGELLDVPAGLRAADAAPRFHVATPLAQTWGRPGPARWSSAEIRQRIADARAANGLFTLDIPLPRDLQIAPEQVALVRSATGTPEASHKEARQ
ncbi:hypothetical protein [Xylophilus sp. GOD-11R]|uniref:hypothetical protein n=1 Tax=Xylophilus sp. GOD-11R TaxID=3089814 RepID=UPI00298D2094|nr:hypothetical protein [Xylophilus sp. GOD-11R]WPB55486.1 hypothetical protein R9X41_15200 [Xylophilus sp. GOD-11R]